MSLHYHYEMYITLTHVFALPPDGAPRENGQRVLSLTHQGHLPGHIVNVKLTKPSIDPVTGATNMKLIDYYTYRPVEPQLECFELILPKRSTVEVLPITIGEHRITGSLRARERVQARINNYFTCCQYIDISDDGHIRGFYRGGSRQKWFWDPMENQHVLKFTIDMTRDPWTVVNGRTARPEWREKDDPYSDLTGREMMFDGMRGKLCYRRPDEWADDRIIVVDIE